MLHHILIHWSADPTLPRYLVPFAHQLTLSHTPLATAAALITSLFAQHPALSPILAHSLHLHSIAHKSHMHGYFFFTTILFWHCCFQILITPSHKSIPMHPCIYDCYLACSCAPAHAMMYSVVFTIALCNIVTVFIFNIWFYTYFQAQNEPVVWVFAAQLVRVCKVLWGF